MSVGGRLSIAESIPNQPDFRGRVEEILSTDHMGYVHVVIIHRIGDQKRRRAVATPNHEILDALMRELDVTSDQVLDHRDAIVWRSKTNDNSWPINDITVTRPAVIPSGQARVFSHLRRLLASEIAEVGLALGDQPLNGSDMILSTIRLEQRPNVPVDSKPLQRLDNGVDKLLLLQRSVGVFDSQHHLATAVAGEQPVEQCRAGTANMQITGRGRSETHARSSHVSEASAARNEPM